MRAGSATDYVNTNKLVRTKRTSNYIALYCQCKW